MDKIVCIGKNYHEHIKELAHLSRSVVPAVNPVVKPRGDGQLRDDKNNAQDDKTIARDDPVTSPVVFIKPPSVLQIIKNHHTGKLKYPADFGSVHFETEIVLRIHKECYKVAPENGHKYFDAVSVGLDMTLRDLQTAQKKQGFPWTTSKVFPDSAVCGEWIELSKIEDFENKIFSFTLNGVQRQTGKAKDMIWSCSQCVSYLSQFFKLLPGDIIYTGTPAGVGPVRIGDVGKLQYHTINYSVEWIA